MRAVTSNHPPLTINMHIKSLWAVVPFLLLVTSNSTAQVVYKTVGPDGQIIYTDRPPANGKNVKVLGTPKATTPSTTATAAESTAQPESARKAMGKRAMRDQTPASDQALPAEREPALSQHRLDAELENAVIIAIGYSDLLQQAEIICTRTLPTSFQKYEAASVQWQQRNGVLVARARQALASVADSTQQNTLQREVKRRTQRMLASVNAAPAASKIKWCDRSVAEIRSGVMDLHNKQHVALPLMRYRAKTS